MTRLNPLQQMAQHQLKAITALYANQSSYSLKRSNPLIERKTPEKQQKTHQSIIIFSSHTPIIKESTKKYHWEEPSVFFILYSGKRDEKTRELSQAWSLNLFSILKSGASGRFSWIRTIASPNR